MAQASQQETIRWQEWHAEAFQLAERESKPILLTLTATWCHWCHVLDQTSYAHPDVIHLINTRFIPIRVDVDRRPDLAVRYNQGGFPSVVILNAQGTPLTGRVYVPPEEMVQLLHQVSAQYPTIGDIASGDSTSPTGQMVRPAPTGTGDTPFDRVLQRLQATYDKDFGGFGPEPKQPPWEALTLLLALYSRGGDKTLLQMACTTLDNMWAGLYDRKDQGFFRYAVSRDWQVPHYEKMLATNTNLGSVYLAAYQVTGRKRYRDIALGILTYLQEHLYDPQRGVFYASQDAAETYYRLPWKDRDHAAQPRIDRTGYTGLNAMVASTLSTAYGVCGQERYLSLATRVLDRLWSQGWEAAQGLRHIIDDPTFSPRFLTDHVAMARAVLEGYQVTGEPEWLDRAVAVVRCINALFGAPDGGYYDSAGSVDERTIWDARHKPLLENARLAEVLVTVATLTGESHSQHLARQTLEAFQDVVPGRSYLGPAGLRRMEEDEEALFLPAGAAWGRAWDLLVHGPVHLVLVGSLTHPRARGLFKAAQRVYVPHRVLQLLDPDRDAARIAALGFPRASAPALYVCLGGMCLAPLATPADVRALRTTRPWEVRAGSEHRI
jgi:uncharacterized protein YyaL (SSP411 family)